MLKKLYGFVGDLSFLPHCGEEEEIPDIPVGENFGFNPKKNQPDDERISDSDYQFLHDKTEPSEDDWEELDYEEDDFDAMMRKKERREAEIFAWSVFGLGTALVAGAIFLVCRSLSKAKA